MICAEENENCCERTVRDREEVMGWWLNSLCPGWSLWRASSECPSCSETLWPAAGTTPDTPLESLTCVEKLFYTDLRPKATAIAHENFRIRGKGGNRQNWGGLVTFFSAAWESNSRHARIWGQTSSCSKHNSVNSLYNRADAKRRSWTLCVCTLWWQETFLKHVRRRRVLAGHRKSSARKKTRMNNNNTWEGCNTRRWSSWTWVINNNGYEDWSWFTDLNIQGVIHEQRIWTWIMPILSRNHIRLGNRTGLSKSADQDRTSVSKTKDLSGSVWAFSEYLITAMIISL